MAFCERTSTGNAPLSDGLGLYASGNQPPADHLARGIAAGGRAVRRLPDGTPGTGKTAKRVVLAIGMSNWKQEIAEMIRQFRLRYGLSRHITWVNGGKGAWDAPRMAGNLAEYWAWLDTALVRRNITYEQVGVILLKNSIARQSSPPEKLADYHAAVIDSAADRFPNLQQVLISSAGYSGYCSSGVRLEPDGWLEGLACRQLILSRIGQPGPWIGWGAYAWADGTTPRQDGLRWLCSDFATDGVHPGPAAKAKWANEILEFLENNQVAKGWFLP